MKDLHPKDQSVAACLQPCEHRQTGPSEITRSLHVQDMKTVEGNDGTATRLDE